MANNEKVIKSINAQSFAGEFDDNEGNYNVAGSFTTDGQKNINNIHGSVKASDIQKATFDAWKNDKTYRYSFSDIDSVSELADIASAVEAAVTAIESEIASE